MKKMIMLLVIAVLMVGTTSVYGEGFGVKAGVNMASMSDFDNSKSLLGFAFGGYYSFSLSENVEIQPEVLFSQKGVKFEETIGVFDLTESFNLTYLEIPILFKYNFSGETLKPYVFAGPYIGLKLSAKYKREVNGVEAPDEDLDGVKGMDFGATFGAGFAYGSISLDVRYSLGLAKVAEDGDTKNSSLSVMVGYGF